MSSINDQGVLNYLGQVGGMAAGSSSGSSRSSGSSGGNSWYQAMAKAWGNTLDRTATDITAVSDQIGGGADKPSDMVQLTTMSLKFGFQSQNASTSIKSIGEGLSATARKQ